ncbi:M48 family metallopeptidase [Aromatoleum diolicum]|uniref:DUF45 domain-containing protein n=1 Tax=Aromatoleum diolicum TaxID=75796 RepID=A0ABX1QEC8_9RHOO|nr:SprT family zinc-dependent metalloprotease [Aromatoleum diolicum]NMG76335.1 DUF45 domain-containing protein [Aromatoleum diolicum]
MAGQGLKRLTGRLLQPTASEEARVICLDAREVVYVLRRSARRSFALQIDHRGVRVAVPWSAQNAEVERFIRGHGRWILDKLAARAAHTKPETFEPADGAVFSVLGESCRLRLGGGGRLARWRGGADGIEELVLPLVADPRALLIRALRRRALPWFAERVAEYCFRIGRDVPAVKLSSAKTRWGSCSNVSGIRLHWRLVHLPPSLIDYVVAHEVAHLVEMNHSPRFWAVVGELYPGWKEARVRLRAAGRTLPVIAGDAADEPFHED